MDAGATGGGFGMGVGGVGANPSGKGDTGLGGNKGGKKNGKKDGTKKDSTKKDRTKELKALDKIRFDKKTAFILEMTYCGLFKLPNVAEDILEKQIKVECPKMLFPYIRRIISQTMIESSMPNIDIKNINFFDI